MRLIFKIVMFTVFFQIALIAIASTGWFENAFYTDTLGIGRDASMIPTEQVLFDLLIKNPATDIVRLWGFNLTFSVIMGTLIIAVVAAAILTKQTTVLAMGLVSYLFWTMYTNSRGAIDAVTSNLGSMSEYLILMVGVGVMITFIIALMDFASGQRSTS